MPLNFSVFLSYSIGSEFKTERREAGPTKEPHHKQTVANNLLTSIAGTREIALPIVQ